MSGGQFFVYPSARTITRCTPLGVTVDELTKSRKWATGVLFYRCFTCCVGAAWDVVDGAVRAHVPGQHTASTRSAHGQHMASTRSARGQRTASTRSAHGQRTVSARSAHGQRTASARPAHGQRTASARPAHGRHTVSTRSAHGQRTASARPAHGQHTVSARPPRCSSTCAWVRGKREEEQRNENGGAGHLLDFVRFATRTPHPRGYTRAANQSNPT